MTRRPATVLALLTALLVLVGCSSASSSGAADPTDDPVAANEAIADKLAEDFTKIPGVVSVTTNYQDNFTAQASLQITVAVATTADFTPVLDEMTRQIWLSEIDPLRAISFSARDSDLNYDNREYIIDQDADRAALEQLYGPRPD